MTILDKPPAGWKRPSIPLSVKVEVLERTLRQLWATGTPPANWGIEYDHRPPLSERLFDRNTGDTIPPANDPDHLEAVPAQIHRERTFGRGGEKRVTTLGSDAHNRAKVRRISLKEAESIYSKMYRNIPIHTIGEPIERYATRTYFAPRQGKLVIENLGREDVYVSPDIVRAHMGAFEAVKRANKRSRPLPGGKGSKLKKKLSGKVVKRSKR